MSIDSRLNSQTSMSSQLSFFENQPDAILYLRENTETDDSVSESDDDNNINSDVFLEECSSDGK